MGQLVSLMFWLFICATCSAVPWSNGISPDLRDRLQNEAAPQWKEYAEKLKHYQGRLVCTISDQNGNITNRFRHVAKTDGTSVLFEQSQLIGEANQHCWVKNPQYAFELRRKSDATPWLLGRFLRNPKKAVFPDDIVEDKSYLFSPFNADPFALPELMQDSRFVITNIEQIAGGLVRLAFRYDQTEAEKKAKESHPGNGWCILDPSRHWVVSEYEVRRPPPLEATVHRKNEFRTSQHGIPVLVKGIENNLRSGKPERRIVEYEIQTGAPAAVDFTLSAFGLPEPKVATRSTPWYLWFGLAAAVCFVIVLILRSARGSNLT